MKKTVVLILLILPIFLIITISFAGRVFSIYNHIYVERVVFVDEFEEELDKRYVLKLGEGESKSTKIKIFPELATNKKVNYLSQDVSIARVNASGVVTGENFGTTTIIVKTVDSLKMASLIVMVTEDNVTGVKLAVNQKELSIGEIYTLTAIITPYTALDKQVKWSSSNKEVAQVNQNGKITAISDGEATITVTTDDGEFTDSCIITVNKDKENPFAFDKDKIMWGEVTGEFIKTSTNIIDLKDSLKYNNSIQENQIKFYIISGSAYAEINENTGVITLNAYDKLVTIVAHVGERDMPDYQAEITLLYVK